MHDHIIAVDVGTGSARAGVFDLRGRQLSRHVTAISLHQSEPRHLEQDSDEIWSAVCTAVRAALSEAGLPSSAVLAIGFDATCSLVVRDKRGKPLSVSMSGRRNLDTMLWMDHRAIDETDACNSTDDPILQRFGGRLSVEMQVPKLLWLKRHLPDTWSQAGMIFDLADYLTWRATGLNHRGHSALAAKWGYGPIAPGERPDRFYERVGLADLSEKSALPEKSGQPTAPVGRLTTDAAEALGLTDDCMVAPGLIDAYAGTISLFCATDRSMPATLENQAALIAGTSSCIVRLLDRPVSGEGCWGTFRDVAVPDLWLLEAGQSASGALLDHIVSTHPQGGEPNQARHRAILDHIGLQLQQRGADYGLPITVLPDFHGTRSPTSDPRLTGTMAGLSLDRSFDGLCQIYWRSCVALACGVKYIIDRLPPDLVPIKTLLLAGGLAHHPLLSQLYADATGCTVRKADGCDAVLLGTALHTAVAAGRYPDFWTAGQAMAVRMTEIAPDTARKNRLTRDHALLREMIHHRDALHRLM
ncbi:FGGY family pentulose kinase [Rhizobium sp. CECT 9324]|uniref:FGGY family pentulose kinase n=1 Tax=Rhizobium sp. CECT 9324 TaxID=2845820 RepID=UPI001E2C9848|nr:FGGY family pentulose kinase [Rhizobium sp. CECT 9324]CAH0338885.1 Ribulokinase [Rhizobium sp. CECT 9324]